LNFPRPVWHNQAIPYQAEFSLNGNLHELQRLSSGIEEFCTRNALGEDVAFQLNLVLEELFVNTLRHGGCEGVANSTRIQLRPAPEGVAVEFRDCGVPFDPTAAPPADLLSPLETRRDGGLGIHLVREIMREVRYRREGEWNHLSMLLPSHAAE
jgi:serine/threonine-protein kinase RsbW